MEELCKDEKKNIDEIEMLELIIDDYDKDFVAEYSYDYDPVQWIKLLLEKNGHNYSKLANILNSDRSTVSRIMSYQTRLTYKNAAKIAEHYKLQMEPLLRPYDLKPKKGVKPQKRLQTPDSKIKG